MNSRNRDTQNYEIGNLPVDIRERIQKIEEKTGFIPNVFLRLATRHDEFRAFFLYHDALMEKPSGLSRTEKEMIVVSTSATNNCIYCVVAHGAVLRIRSKDKHIADQIAINYRRAEISERERVMLDFATKVAESSYKISKKDFDLLKNSGFSEDDIRDIVSIVSFFAMSNRLANSLSIKPNEEFYAMGR